VGLQGIGCAAGSVSGGAKPGAVVCCVTARSVTPGGQRCVERAVAVGVQEVAEFRNFEHLRQALIEVNQRICRLRPPMAIEPWSTGKKTAARIHQEMAREVNQLLDRIFAQRHKTAAPIWRPW